MIISDLLNNLDRKSHIKEVTNDSNGNRASIFDNSTPEVLANNLDVTFSTNLN